MPSTPKHRQLNSGDRIVTNLGSDAINIIYRRHRMYTKVFACGVPSVSFRARNVLASSHLTEQNAFRL